MTKRTPTLYRHLKARGVPPAQLAKLLGVNKSTVTRWSRNRVPAERVAEIVAFTGIPASVLRPDIFQPQPQGEAA